MTDTWMDRLSEYLDGELSAPERAALEAHLASCRDCATALDELREVVARAAALTPRPPANDLWPGIEPQLHAGALLPFRARPARRFSFTVAQLVAAGVALMVVSGGGVWVLQHGGRATALPATQATNEVPAGVMVTALSDPRYDEAIADLEQALDADRGRLDPGTMKVFEANLAAIDKAIDESRRALAEDPANVYLNTHLADARQRKLALLRRATALVGPKDSRNR
jgi:tetratricopeptide (TPR) repeat protein